jgi:hypothetical protein
MKAHLQNASPTAAAATVAPEDLRCGDYVAVLNEIVEIPSCCWLELASHPPEEPVRVRLMARDSGLPLKVQAICLPFVYVRTPEEWSESLDVRRVQFVRVSRSYARMAWKQARKERERLRRARS